MKNTIITLLLLSFGVCKGQSYVHPIGITVFKDSIRFNFWKYKRPDSVLGIDSTGRILLVPQKKDSANVPRITVPTRNNL